MSKYDPLRRWLETQDGTELRVSLADIESIIGARLPASAHQYPEWWANEDLGVTQHVQCRAWRNAGWLAFLERPSTVRFTREAP